MEKSFKICLTVAFCAVIASPTAAQPLVDREDDGRRAEMIRAFFGQEIQVDTNDLLERYADLKRRAIGLEGVQGVGIGVPNDDVKNAIPGRPVFRVYVNRLALSTLALSLEAGPYPVLFIPVDKFTGFAQPMMGSSTRNNSGKCYTGTLGIAAERDGVKGYITNNHVAAADKDEWCPNGFLGKQLAPGRTPMNHDCREGEVVGDLTSKADRPAILFSKKNYADCAFVEEKGNGVDPANRCGICPANATILPAAKDMEVQKCGAATDLTSGKVKAIADIEISYPACGPKAAFLLQIEVSGKGFAHRGDSGSLMYSGPRWATPNAIVGLLFAGDGSETTFVNPMTNVLVALPGTKLVPPACK